MPHTADKLWQEQARRLGGDDLVSTIETMGHDIHEIKKNMKQLTDTAFPGGDLDSHRRYHELLIENTIEKRRLRRAIQEKTISGLVWAIIAGTGLAVWHEITSRIVGSK